MYMLRWKLGDDVFFKGIRRYQKDPKVIYGFAKTADLQRNLEEESGQDLSKFFKDWFAGQGYPTYKVEWSQIGNTYVKIKMDQTTSHTSVSFFDLPVALKFKNTTQEKIIVLDNKTNGESFIRNIGFIADTVLIDPDYWLVTKNNTSKKIVDAVTGQNIVQVFPNPFRNQFYIYLHDFTSPTAAINLYNAIGQLVYTKTFNLYNGTEYIEVPTAQLASGVYTLRVTAGNNFKYVKKLLK